MKLSTKIKCDIQVININFFFRYPQFKGITGIVNILISNRVVQGNSEKREVEIYLS